jgi:hypothetical protein
MLLEGGSYAAAAQLRMDPEGFDVALPQRFAVVHDRGLPASAPITCTR